VSTKLEFEATITDAKPVIAKTSYDKGKLLLTLTLHQPSAPSAPSFPYEFNASGYGTDGGNWKPCPEDLKRKKDESDDDYAARNKARSQEKYRWLQSKARYDAQVAAFATEQAAYQARLMSYASLIGLASVFGNKPLTVTLVPMEQGLLPDYGVSLLAPPEPVDVTPPAEPVIGANITDECPQCGHQRGYHDDDLPPGCSVYADGVPCECERGMSGW